MKVGTILCYINNNEIRIFEPVPNFNLEPNKSFSFSYWVSF